MLMYSTTQRIALGAEIYSAGSSALDQLSWIAVSSQYVHRPAPPSAALNTRGRIAFGGCSTTSCDVAASRCSLVNAPRRGNDMLGTKVRRCRLFRRPNRSELSDSGARVFGGEVRTAPKSWKSLETSGY